MAAIVSQKTSATISAILLCLLSFGWVLYSFVIRTRTEKDMRRELQAFEMRLSGIAEVASPDVRQHLLNHRVTRAEDGRLVLMAPSEDETFEEMRVRITKRIQLPMWPGVAFGVLGLALLIYSIATPNTPNARNTAVNGLASAL